ncbi:MAG: alpha/beta hydrolase [Bryobacteraceae bacterium]
MNTGIAQRNRPTRRAILQQLTSTAALATLLRAQSFNQTRTADFGGIPIQYETYGLGPEALVFIHGWTCDRTFWRGQAPVYTRYRSLLIDLPGHGESGKPHTAYPMEMFAKSIDAVMKDAGVERATFVGHSLGGPIVYAYLRLFPEKAKAMALVDVDVRKGSAGPMNVEEQRIRMARRAMIMAGPTGEKDFHRTVESCFTKQTPESIKEEIRTKMLATPKYVRIASLTSPSSLPPPKKDETYTLPSIAIQASSPATEINYRAMKTLFPSLELEIWKGSGHFLMMEDPQRFNQSLEQFLQKLS